jgi:hypothetical protein
MIRPKAHPDVVDGPAGPPENGVEIVLSIGGIVGHLTLGPAPAPFVEQLRQRYSPYAVPPAPWVERAFSLRIAFSPAAAGVDRYARAGEVAAHPLRVEESDRSIRIARWDFRAGLAPEVGSGRGVRTQVARSRSWSGEVTCQMNPFAFDSLLRVLWSIFLPRSGGALFHACALRLDEAGVIFPGPSGAGKSTLARKIPEPERILTDELVAVSRGEMGSWRISGTPFWGEFKRGGGSIRSWPLRAVSFLEQGQTLTVQVVPPAEATLRLLGCFLCFQTDAETAARNLAIALELCTEVITIASRTARETPIADIEQALGPYLPDRHRRDHPPTPREMISEFRWFLLQNRQYAYKPRGTSMRPWLRAGDALFIQVVGEAETAPGDILLYWTPGRTAHEDRLTCHRMVARLGTQATPTGKRKFKFYMKGDARSSIEGFENGRESEILGRVFAVSRDGRTMPVPGRIGNLARLLGSLVATPILKMTGR